MYYKLNKLANHLLLTTSLLLHLSTAANLKDVLLPSYVTSHQMPGESEYSGTVLVRLPRETKYPSRYGTGSSSTTDDKNLKPENTQDTRDPPSDSNVGKRCIRCETGYYDRYPQDGGRRYYDRDYDDRDRYNDRDRYYDRDRYDRYPDRGDIYLPPRSRYGSPRSRYDRYDDRYDRYDRYYDRASDKYDRYGDYDRYEPSERYDRYNDRYSDDRYDRYPSEYRGVGYDNRGYDYREKDGGAYPIGYRGYDETYRGTSGFDGAGRGYYFADRRPDYGARGYADGYDYGSSGGGRDGYYRERDRYDDRYYRAREPYDNYRTTSYLHDRPSTTTTKPSESSDRERISSDSTSNSGSG